MRHACAQANERQRAEADGDRIKELQDKLVLRIRPFVEAKNPGDPSDSETKVFEQRIRTEAEDMKLESFGIEVRTLPPVLLMILGLFHEDIHAENTP